MTQPDFRRTSTTAVISLVSGLLGWTVLPFVGAIVAIVTGHAARADIRREPRMLQGDGLAVAGLILGYAMVAVSLMALVAVLLLGGLAAIVALANWS